MRQNRVLHVQPDGSIRLKKVPSDYPIPKEIRILMKESKSCVPAIQWLKDMAGEKYKSEVNLEVVRDWLVFQDAWTIPIQPEDRKVPNPDNIETVDKWLKSQN